MHLDLISILQCYKQRMQVQSKLWLKSLSYKRNLASSILFLLLAFALRGSGLGQQSIWFDEGWSAHAAIQPGLVAAANADMTNPPLYYVLLNIHASFLGDSTFSLRLFSLFAGMVALALVYALAQMLFERRTALWALILAALSAPLWWAAREARMYTLLAALLLLLAVAWYRLFRRPQWKIWLLLMVAEVLALYAHNTGPVLVLWVNFMTLLAWLVYHGLGQLPWRSWVASQIVVAICWMPYFVTRFLLLQSANNAVVRRPIISLAYLGEVWQGLWFSPWEMIGRESLIAWLALVLLALWLVLFPWRWGQVRWLAGHVLVLVSSLLLGLAVLGNELHGRYLVMIVPLLLIPLAAGLARLKPVLLRLGIAGLLTLAFALNLALAANPAYQHDDAHRMVQYYANALTAGDSVLAWSYADRYDLSYYWDRLGVEAERITLPEGADLTDIEPLLPQGGDVALNIWYTQRADFRGMMDCLLSQGTVNAPDDYAVQGMRTYIYREPELAILVMQPFQIDIMMDGVMLAQIGAVGQISPVTAERAICVPLWLEVLQSVQADLKAALMVRNALGWEIARTDVVFATANQRTTSALQPGEAATAYVLLRLPFGAPAETYTVSLQVYDEQIHPDGYDLGSTSEVGRSVLLGEWAVQAGADWSVVRRTSALSQAVHPDVTGQMRLLAHDAQSTTMQTGERVRLSLLWQGEGSPPDLTLTGDGWELRVPSTATIAGFGLDWREIQIPADATGGEAELRLPDGEVLARYMVEVLPMLTIPPAHDYRVEVEFPGVGQLMGYSVADGVVSLHAPLPVTLIWQAGDTQTSVNYTVFVQLLDEQGLLIAQSDAIPGGRPTDGWRAGEYILDAHALNFNEQAHPGPAYLIVGLYDPLTGQRIILDEGDFVRLPGEIVVE